MSDEDHILGRIHHYGVAAESIEEMIGWLERHSTVRRASVPIWDALQQAWLSLVEVPGGTLEIVAGPIVRGVLEKGRMGYHVCFEVDDVDAALASLVSGGGAK